MLSRIESTEARMRSYVQDNHLPAPKEAAFLFMDGSASTPGSPGEASSQHGAKQPLGVSAPPSPDGSRRRSMQRGEAEFSHAPVPSVEEARNRRSSIRRASVVGSPGGGLATFEEFHDRTRQLVVEAKHLMKVYLGLEAQGDGETPLGLDWKEKKREKTVTVWGTAVAGNTWNAVRAVGCVRASKEDILGLIMDDKRIGEFDDMFDNCTVSFSPTSKRFIYSHIFWGQRERVD